MKLDNALLIDLEYAINKDIVFSDNISYSHVFIERYKISKNNEILSKINKFYENRESASKYVRIPLEVNYDSVVNNMKNYHIIIPQLLSESYDTIEDLFMLYQISKNIRQEMYDEYDKVRKHFAKELERYIAKDNNILVGVLIKMAVYMRVINVEYLKYCNHKDANLGPRELRIVLKANEELEKMIDENGMKLLSNF